MLQIQILFCLDSNSLINCNKFVILVRLRVMLLNNFRLILFDTQFIVEFLVALTINVFFAFKYVLFSVIFAKLS